VGAFGYLDFVVGGFLGFDLVVVGGYLFVGGGEGGGVGGGLELLNPRHRLLPRIKPISNKSLQLRVCKLLHKTPSKHQKERIQPANLTKPLQKPRRKRSIMHFYPIRHVYLQAYEFILSVFFLVEIVVARAGKKLPER